MGWCLTAPTWARPPLPTPFRAEARVEGEGPTYQVVLSLHANRQLEDVRMWVEGPAGSTVEPPELALGALPYGEGLERRFTVTVVDAQPSRGRGFVRATDPAHDGSPTQILTLSFGEPPAAPAPEPEPAPEPAPPPAPEPAGCGCTAAPTSVPWLAVLVGLLTARVRSRAARAAAA